MRAVLTCASAQ